MQLGKNTECKHDRCFRRSWSKNEQEAELVEEQISVRNLKGWLNNFEKKQQDHVKKADKPVPSKLQVVKKGTPKLSFDPTITLSPISESASTCAATKIKVGTLTNKATWLQSAFKNEDKANTPHQSRGAVGEQAAWLQGAAFKKDDMKKC